MSDDERWRGDRPRFLERRTKLRHFADDERRDPREQGPGFRRGGAGERRYVGPPVQGGYADQFVPPHERWREADFESVDPYRGTVPSGPSGWTWEESGESFRGPKGYRRSDERILEELCDRLTFDPRIDASEIEVRVTDAEVVLTGRAATRFEKRLAEDHASHVRGVRDVINQIRVARTLPVPRAQTSEQPPRKNGRTGASR